MSKTQSVRPTSAREDELRKCSRARITFSRAPRYVHSRAAEHISIRACDLSQAARIYTANKCKWPSARARGNGRSRARATARHSPTYFSAPRVANYICVYIRLRMYVQEWVCSEIAWKWRREWKKELRRGLITSKQARRTALNGVMECTGNHFYCRDCTLS